MKKTSLLLAISALLYGTSSVYALEINENLTDDQILEIIDQIPDVPESTDPQGAEDAGITDDGSVSGTQGLDPPQPLDPNVALDNSHVVEKPAMCPKSFQVNGNEMAEFPVTVTDTVNGTKTVQWKALGGTKGGAEYNYLVAVGPGWMLVQQGDTWSAPWRLLTTVPITKILLEPLERDTSNDPKGEKRVYAFDVGGKRPTAPAPVGPYEHTPGSARGWFIKQVSPSLPPPIFTATYSDPVYTVAHNVPDATIPISTRFDKDGTNIPLIPPYGTGDPSISRIPTHDLYGTLEINFDLADPAVGDLQIDPGFAFRADTDCILLPVVGASFSSNLLTLFGEGLVYVKETNSRGGYSLMPTPFEVAKDGVNTFDVGGLISNLQANHCYSLVNEGSLDKNIPLEVNGEDVPGDRYCK